MSKQYSQVRATMAVAKASLRAIFRSPSTVVFSLGFPLIFILVFGFLGSGGKVSLKVGFDPASDTSNIVFQSLKDLKGLNIQSGTYASMMEELQKGRMTALLNIIPPKAGDSSYKISILTSDAVNPQQVQVLRSLLEGKISGLNAALFPNRPTIAQVEVASQAIKGRVYRTIDFILPGQLGFSLLSAGVFGVAFLFIGLRQTLVLKRFFATPVTRTSILVGEGISRVIFQLSTAVVILLVGHFFFQFTLVHGWVTFIELLVLSLIGLFVFMGFGFVVSGIAKNESAVPPIANIVTMPQFLLAGTFFSIDAFPAWLQPFCRVLPLTYLNDAMRNVAFEGMHLADCGKQLGALGIWIILVYAAAVKLFKWE